MLIALAGLSGTGKTTIARALSRRLGATHLRIDTIEQALRTSKALRSEVGPDTRSPTLWRRTTFALAPPSSRTP